MEQAYGVSCGIWEIKQDRSTLEVVLFKYGEPIAFWAENHALSWAELYEKLAANSRAMTSGNKEEN